MILDGYHDASPPLKVFVNHLLEDPHLYILLTSTPEYNELEPLITDFGNQIELQVLGKNYPDSDLFQVAVENRFPFLSEHLIKQVALYHLKAPLEKHCYHFQALSKLQDEHLKKSVC